MSNKRSNFLFFVTDQEYAHQALPEGMSLPNREQMRANGVTFTNYHTAHTGCTPSRATIYAGMHPAHTGMTDNTNFAWASDMSIDILAIGHMLREAGYYTALKGRWHEAELPAENIQDFHLIATAENAMRTVLRLQAQDRPEQDYNVA